LDSQNEQAAALSSLSRLKCNSLGLGFYSVTEAGQAPLLAPVSLVEIYWLMPASKGQKLGVRAMGTSTCVDDSFRKYSK
jgi:hypothetical protein